MSARSERSARRKMAGILADGLPEESIYGTEDDGAVTTIFLAGGGPEVILHLNHHIRMGWVKHRDWLDQWQEIPATKDEMERLYAAACQAVCSDF